MEVRDKKFDDICPYYDEDIPGAMERISSSNFFALMASYVFPGQDVGELRSMIRSLKTINDFQMKVMYHLNEQIISDSISDFSYNGLEHIEKGKSYLYVSNHRDIMLDSSLLQYILVNNGYDTTEITFGANLMSSNLIIDIGKSNKMFRVERGGGNMKDFYSSSFHLSEYIRYVIKDKHSSVWIAHRNGRTKDGNDCTDKGIIKMFSMSNTSDKIASLSELNIVPVSISYEWEPCDVLKTLELFESRKMPYIKKPGEDLTSILTGIVQKKGTVHIEICPRITRDDLLVFDKCTHNEFNRKVAKLIDDRIIKNYRLSQNNYIAHDMLYGQDLFKSHYTDAQKDAFIDSMKKLEKYEMADPEVLREIFLRIYANPVTNFNKLNTVIKGTNTR